MNKNLNPLYEKIDVLSQENPKPNWFTKKFQPKKAQAMMQQRADVARRVRADIGQPNHPDPRAATYDLTRKDAYAKNSKDKYATMAKLHTNPGIFG